MKNKVESLTFSDLFTKKPIENFRKKTAKVLFLIPLNNPGKVFRTQKLRTTSAKKTQRSN